MEAPVTGQNGKHCVELATPGLALVSAQDELTFCNLIMVSLHIKVTLLLVNQAKKEKKADYLQCLT